ncbi:MAG: hypothetical protein ACK4F8_10730 [Aquabacterium sp.]
MPSQAPTHPSAHDMPSLTLNLRQAHTMSQGGVPVKHEDPAELQRWHELVAQVGRELAGPLTTAMERLNTWSTTGQVDRAGLRALKEEVDQARQAGIWCQQIARLASGRVQPSQERVHLTNTVQSVLAYRNRELQARGISISQTLLPAEILVDASMLFSLINSIIDWWLGQAIGQVELRIDRTAWPERARLQCSFHHTPPDQQDAQALPPALSNLNWFVLEQTARTMGLSLERDTDSQRARLSVEFPNTVAIDLPTLIDEAYADHDAVNSKPLAGSHVLVIANRRDLRIQVREALKAMGLVLDFVSNLKEASEFCREGFPHAIIFEAGLHTAAFDKLAQDIRKEVPEFVFIELVDGSDHFDISSVSRTGMARVGTEAIPDALPSALVYELTRVM